MKMKKEGMVSSPFAQKRDDALQSVIANTSPHEEYFSELYIEALEEPVRVIFDQFRNEIDRGSFKLIIGDDASGRIPTFIIAHALKAIYEAKKFQPPIVRFIAGSTKLTNAEREIKTKQVAVQIGEMKETALKAHGVMGTALVVTDVVNTGRSLRVLFDALSENHIDTRAVAIGSSPVSHLEHLTKGYIEKLFIAHEGEPPYIYNLKDLSGVQKDVREIFAVPAEGVNRERGDAARALALGVAQTIATEFLKKKP